MRLRLLLLTLLPLFAATNPAVAGDDEGAKILSQLRTARQEQVPEKIQLWAGARAVEYLRKKSGWKIDTDKTAMEIFNRFALDPKAFEELAWVKNNNSVETDIFSELTQLFDQIGIKRKIDACYFAKGGRGFGEQLNAGAAGYSTSCEGGWTRKIITYEYLAKEKEKPPSTLGEKTKKKGVVEPERAPSGKWKSHTVEVPLFVWPPGFEQALGATHDLLNQSDFTPSPEGETKWFPSADAIRAAFGSLNREAITALQIRKDMYERTLSRNFRNKLGLVARYARVPANRPIAEIAAEILNQDCKYCSPDQRRRLTKRLQTESEQDEKSGMIAPTTPGAVRDSLCAKLKAEGYPFDEEILEKKRKAYGKPRGSLHNAQIEQAGMKADAVDRDLHNKRRAILGKLIRSGGDNLLFLSTTLTELSQNKPGNARLGCKVSDAASDEKVVAATYKAVLDDVNLLRTNLEKSVDPSRPLRDLDTQNTELLNLSPKTFGEALMRNTVDGSDYACKLVEKVERKDMEESEIELMKMWGVGLVTLACPILGAAVRGSMLSYSLLATGAAVDIGYAADQIDRASDKSDLAIELGHQAIGLGGDDWVLRQSDKAWADYQTAKWSAILTLGMSPLQWGGIVKRAVDRIRTSKVVGSQLEIHSDELIQALEAETKAETKIVTVEKPVATPETPIGPVSPAEPVAPRGKSAAFKEWKIEQVKTLPADTNAKFMKMSQAEVQAAVNGSPIKAIHPLKGGGQSKAYIVELENGMIGIYKPDRKFQSFADAKISVNAGNEIAASSVDELYGFGLTPSTVNTNAYIYAGHKGMTSGSFQLLEGGVKSGNEFLAAGGKIDVNSAIKTDLFDSLIDQSDRYAGNFLVRPNGTVVTVDNGKSFANGEAHYNRMFPGGTKNSDYSVEKRLENMKSVKIGKITPDDRPDTYLAFSLRNHYNDADVAAFFRSGEGKALVTKLERTDAAAISAHLRKSAPSLSPREVAAYTARIERRSRLLLDYAKASLK